jgi:PTS system D-glucosamine-specific IIC component
MKIFAQVQRIGKALMTPVAILPAAGLFLAFGNKLQIPLMEQAGGVIFGNLPLLFAVGTAIGLAHGEGVAALAAIVAMLIMNTTMGIVSGAEAGLLAGDRAFAEVLGIPTLQTGVFGGIIAGVIAAVLYNKYYKIELPAYLGFFAGKRFVPIVTAIVAFIVGLVMPIIWEPIQAGLMQLSYLANETNTNVSTFIFGVVERSLIPFGLHHIFYSPFWFQFGEYTNAAGDMVNGDQAIWFAMLKDNVANFSSATYQGAGKFMTGKFAFMMFGLPGAALAMYHEAKPEKRKIASGILFSAALTSFLTGITEPIEFAFLFVAPILYGIHVVIAGTSFMLMNMLNVRIGMTFSGGLIDFIMFGVLPNKTPWFWVIVVGLGFAVVYYFLFRFAIRKWDLKTPGREDDDMEEESTHLSGHELGVLVMDALGGKGNLKTVDSCITRLRVEVENTEVINDGELKKLGAAGVLKVGQNGVQVIFGAKAQFIANDINKMIRN